MFKLIYKEFSLAAHPTLIIFMFLGLMIIIPSYPYTVVLLFGCLGPFMSFLYARETNDIFYTVLLPVKKDDVVKGKLLMTIIAQIGQLLISAPIAVYKIVTNFDLNSIGIEANVAYYGLSLISFAIFNLIFFTNFYKTAYKAGQAFLLAIIPSTVVNVAIEAVSHIPATQWLDGISREHLIKQLPVLIVGIIIYAAFMALTYKISVNRFRRVDL
ncbi:MAG: ABC-2 transporter permease [Christensenellaceae bacterium]|nr:ABC-2 transporter permease [Christensenellaceae bacterium]